MIPFNGIDGDGLGANRVGEVSGEAGVEESGVAAAGRETGTVARVVMVLRALADHPEGPTAKELAEVLNLPVSTVHRLLELLAREGMAQRDEITRAFRPGPEFVRLASRIAHRTPLVSVAKPFLVAAAREANESTYLGALNDLAGKLEFVATAESGQMLDYRIPMNVPFSLIVGASGLAVLAWLDERRVREIVAGESPAADAAGTFDALRAPLAEIRERGYAMTFGQRIKEAVGISAPVFNGSGAVCASFGFTIPSSRFDPGQSASLARIVMASAGKLSAALGYIGPYPRGPESIGGGASDD
jgi:DNA-binding IclR family transcriptional regulator